MPTGIYSIFRGYRFEPDAEIGPKGVLSKGLKLSPLWWSSGLGGRASHGPPPLLRVEMVGTLDMIYLTVTGFLISPICAVKHKKGGYVV